MPGREPEPGDHFETACRKCGEIMLMVYTEDGWRPCAMAVELVDLGGPRHPLRVVTADGVMTMALAGSTSRLTEARQLHACPIAD